MYFCTQIVRAQRMSPNRIIIFLACLMTYASLYADSVESYVDSIKIYREDLPSHHGEKRINLFGKIYRFSQESEDVNLQRECLYDYLNEAQRQGNLEHEVNARTERIVLFYNNDLNDSVFYYAPIDLKFLREHGEWDQLYEVWGLLVNTYVYNGSATIGLQEAEKMYEDAKARKHNIGLGLAYSAMGDVYFGMNLMENSAKCYQKGINLMMQTRPYPEQLGEQFSSICEVYEKMGDYKKLDRLTIQWREYIDKMIIDHKISPDDPGIMSTWAYYYIGCAQADMGLGRLGRAAQRLYEAQNYLASEGDMNYRIWLYYKAKLAFLQV